MVHLVLGKKDIHVCLEFIYDFLKFIEYCVVPEKIHTHHMKGHWKFLGGGGGGVQNKKTFRGRVYGYFFGTAHY